MVARPENLDRTVEDTTKKSENLEGTPENCLMLLSRVGERGGGDGEGRVFRCKTCMQGFSSFQALGGHRASHNASQNELSIIDSSGDEQSSSLSSGPVTKKTARKTRPHRCWICGLEFPTGQALGGHMRKHRNEEDSGAGALVTRSFFPEAAATAMFTTFKKSSSGKKVECLDLGSDSTEGTINLKLELGRTMN